MPTPWKIRRNLLVGGLGAALALASVSVVAQEAGDGPRPSGIVEEPQPGEEGSGRRLGDLPNDQIRQFQMRRACEQDLPECLPEIRAIIEKEQRNRNFMALGIGGVLLLIFLLAMREAEKKKKFAARERERHRKLGERVKKKWSHEVTDPYRDADPLGDD